jgi:hypothetical protein
MSEKERSDLLKLIRSIVESENGGFLYSPPSGSAAEAVCLRSCAAQFHKSRVSFCRQCDPATNVADAPDKLIWLLQCRAKGDRFVWSVDHLDGVEFSREGLARRILEQLRDYCRSYEDSIRSFAAD